jgi:hypothetical protein
MMSDEFRIGLERLLLWAEYRKLVETGSRPDANIYKRTLIETWNQVIDKLKKEIASL